MKHSFCCIELRKNLGVLRVSGRDRQAWLNGLVTCDLTKKAAGDSGYGCFVRKNGKIISEVWFLFLQDQIMLGVYAEHIPFLMEHMDHHILMEDVSVDNVSDEYIWMFAHGLQSFDLIEMGQRFGFSAAQSDWHPLGCAIALVAANNADAILIQVLEQAPAQKLTSELWNQFRVEGVIPELGVDFDQESYPEEAGLSERAVSYQKGCYLGQEAVFMLHARGHVKKKFVRILVAGDQPISPGCMVESEDGMVVGNVTTSSVVSINGTWPVLGYVKYQYLANSSLRVLGRSARIENK